jgi:hypothetical protein
MTKKVEELSRAEYVELMVRLLKDVIFNGEVRRETSDQVYEKTVRLTNDYILNEMLHLLIKSTIFIN